MNCSFLGFKQRKVNGTYLFSHVCDKHEHKQTPVQSNAIHSKSSAINSFMAANDNFFMSNSPVSYFVDPYYLIYRISANYK